MSKILAGLIFLGLAAAAGCSTASDIADSESLAFPNMNQQAVARPEGLMTPQQSQAEIEALNKGAAAQVAAAKREIEGRQ